MVLKTKPQEWTIWSDPLERADYHVVKSDIAKAVDWYHELTGYYPDAICLSKKTAVLVSKYGSIPAGINLYVKGGCLSWEIWLSGRLVELPSPSPVIDTPETHRLGGNKNTITPKVGKTAVPNYDTPKNAPQSAVKRKKNYDTPKKPGRPRKEGRVSRMTSWRRKKELQGVLIK